MYNKNKMGVDEKCLQCQSALKYTVPLILYQLANYTPLNFHNLALSMFIIVKYSVSGRLCSIEGGM